MQSHRIYRWISFLHTELGPILSHDIGARLAGIQSAADLVTDKSAGDLRHLEEEVRGIINSFGSRVPEQHRLAYLRVRMLILRDGYADFAEMLRRRLDSQDSKSCDSDTRRAITQRLLDIAEAASRQLA